MTVNGTDILDLADKIQGRVKFYHVGDPHRRLLETTFATLRSLAGGEGSMTAESVQDWLHERGVKLTKKQLEKLDLDS